MMWKSRLITGTISILQINLIYELKTPFHCCLLLLSFWLCFMLMQSGLDSCLCYPQLQCIRGNAKSPNKHFGFLVCLPEAATTFAVSQWQDSQMPLKAACRESLRSCRSTGLSMTGYCHVAVLCRHNCHAYLDMAR